MYDAYNNVFTRCGLNFRPVEADSGAIGGSGSHEFTVIAGSGENEIVFCSKCDYAANVEKAELKPIEAADEEIKEKEKVVTPDCKTISDVCAYLKLPVDYSVKAVAYNSNKGLILCFVRGDHEVNGNSKLLIPAAYWKTAWKWLPKNSLRQQEPLAVTWALLALIWKKATVVVDSTVMNMHNICCGANEEGYHFVNVEPKREF